MVCPKCQSENVSVSVTTETSLKEKKHGALYWVFIGWWLKPILWFCLTLPMLIIKIFKPKNYKLQNKTQKIAICQSCGHSWNV